MTWHFVEHRDASLAPTLSVTALTVILDELAAKDGLQISAWLLPIRYLGPLPPAETERMQRPLSRHRRHPRAMALAGRSVDSALVRFEQRAEESVHCQLLFTKKKALGFVFRFRPCWEPKLK